MKNFKNFCIKIFYIVTILLLIMATTNLIIKIFNTTVLADVGSFEDYSSGSSSSGGSSWSSSSSSDHYSSSGSGSGVFIFGGGFGSVIFWIVAIAILLILINNNKNQRNKNGRLYNSLASNDSTQKIQQLEEAQAQIENKIQVNDPDFNKEELVAWSKNLFIKLQQAWTARDWETIRTFETESLFEQHKSQLQGYINNNQINVMDRICVNYAHLYGYRVEGDKEILTVRLNSRMEDYIIDATTKQVIKGQKGLDKVNTYILTFIRKNGVKTKPGTIEVNTTNCPNCGAPTKITSSGKCEYCGSIVTTGEYNWVLSSLQREDKLG